MNLLDSATHTINIEYPGRTLDEAKVDACLRSLDLENKLKELQDQLNKVQFELEQVTHDYHRAVAAASLFDDAIKSIEELEY